MVLHFLDVPPTTDRENEPTARQWSRLATDLAVTIGSRCGTSAMPVPSLSVRVAAAYRRWLPGGTAGRPVSVGRAISGIAAP